MSENIEFEIIDEGEMPVEEEHLEVEVHHIEEAVFEEPVITEEPVISEEPVVEEPTIIEEPVITEEPVVTEEPVITEEPVVEEPVVEEPVITEEPDIEEPVVEELTITEEPVIEEPVVEETVVEEPVVEEPTITEEPVVEEPVIEEPVVEEPVVEELTITEEPVIEEPVVEEPTITEEPVVEEPVVEEAPVATVPKLIFVVPYRDREEQRRFFDLQMTKLLEDYQKGEYKIIYSHQQDQRSFNRGAMKNIGFLHAKKTYPNDYQNITFVFNDVDTMPFNKGFINYDTTPGVVKHFYGYTFTLGGIVSIKGGDFERTNGFPNYWAWGFEDNAFQRRVEQTGLSIDRSQFYPILDKNILQLKDGITRSVNRGEFDRYVNEVLYQTNADGIQTLSGIVGEYDENTRFLNVLSFQTPIAENVELTKSHDLRDGAIPFARTPEQLAATPGYQRAVPRRGRPRMGMSLF